MEQEKPVPWNDLAKAVFAAMELEPKIEYMKCQRIKRTISNFTEADMTKLLKNKIKYKIQYIRRQRKYVSIIFKEMEKF